MFKFTIHKHFARRRHYDLRLQFREADLNLGTKDLAVKSFAIPKGPTLAKGIRRLAIQTPDHTMGCLDFEGVIPQGEYGAGPMLVWDWGEVIYEGEPDFNKSRLTFTLKGEKLEGKFSLVRTKIHESGPKSWLLLKRTDAFCTPGGEVIEVRLKSVKSGLTIEEVRDNYKKDNGTFINPSPRESV